MRCLTSVRSFTAELGKDEEGKEKGATSYNSPQPRERTAGGKDPHEQFSTSPTTPARKPSPSLAARRLMHQSLPEIVVVGTSLGGLRALQVLLADLPKNLPVPVVIAQHRHKDSDDTLSVFLQRVCPLPLTEAEDKEVILPGRVYLAPADYHLLVEAGCVENWQGRLGVGAPTFALSTEAPVSYARPSIDALFESVADAYGEKAIGVILTGASNDGSKGLLKIKANGGKAIVQDPTTAECSVMPKAAISALQRCDNEAVAVDWIVTLGDIAPLIVNLCHLALR